MVTGRLSLFLRYLIVVIVLIKIAQSCPELRQCFPETIETVSCKGDPTPKWTNKPSDIDCSTYISCFNGIGIKMCCPGGMYFNPAIEECDVEINVDCQIEPPPCPQTTTTDIPDTTTDMPDTTTITNPAETTIDLSSTETTVVTEETTSSAAIDTTTVQEGPDLAALCAAQSSDSLLELAFPGDCGLYVVCDNKQYINTESCPAGLHFNPELSLCDSPDHAECLEFLCQNNPDGNQITLPSINSCQRYFICVGNMTLELLCAPGTIYDAENAWCIIDDVNNPCERDRLPPPPEVVIMQCTPESELKKIPHPTICDVYYRCLNGRLGVRKCPAGLFFDSDRDQCNLAEKVSCEIKL